MISPLPRATNAYSTNACLIVEDSEFDRQKLGRIVRNSFRNMPIQEAKNLKAARIALDQGGVSLILLDNNLPDGWGMEFAIEIANTPQMAHIPIIIVSDWPSPFMWQKAAAAGVRHVMSKQEFDSAHLMAAVKDRPQRHVS